MFPRIESKNAFPADHARIDTPPDFRPPTSVSRGAGSCSAVMIRAIVVAISEDRLRTTEDASSASVELSADSWPFVSGYEPG